MSRHTHLCDGPIGSGAHVGSVYKTTDENRRSYRSTCSCGWRGPIRDKRDFVNSFGRPGDMGAARAKAGIDLSEHQEQAQ